MVVDLGSLLCFAKLRFLLQGTHSPAGPLTEGVLDPVAPVRGVPCFPASPNPGTKDALQRLGRTWNRSGRRSSSLLAHCPWEFPGQRSPGSTSHSAVNWLHDSSQSLPLCNSTSGARPDHTSAHKNLPGGFSGVPAFVYTVRLSADL